MKTKDSKLPENKAMQYEPMLPPVFDDYFDDVDEGEILGYVCLGCGNIQNYNNGFGCNRCTGHSLDPWYG